ncbi:MAG: hypothetical protein H7246_15965 [Phycisphaerae bacterium]|nr:hypothetical protein [Saprospiraceae bacterium]
MKVKKQTTKKHAATSTPSADALFAQVTATEKNAEQAWQACEEKETAYEQALKQHTDKTALKGLLAAAKIARLSYKIKKIEHKLAKANWKSASKSDKKPGQAASKDTVKAKSGKTDHKAPKDSGAKGKSGAGSSKAKFEQKGKKKSVAQG